MVAIRDLSVPIETARAGLRALATLARVDGAIEEHEEALLHAAARALQIDAPTESMHDISAGELAASVPDETWRVRIVQAMIVMAMMDGEIAAPELALIAAFEKTLGVDEPRLRHLRQRAKSHLRMVKYDLARRSEMLREAARSAWQHEGLRGLKRYFGSFIGHGEDREMAKRYRRLGLLPEGTLGRAYWAHMTERDFMFPGEPGIVMPQEFVRHDIAHVLGGYDTDGSGEIEVVAFVSGFLQTDPFWYLFAILMHMHLATQVFGGDPVTHLAANPERMVRAFVRGRGVNRDLYDPEFDWWPHFARRLDELREEFGIAPNE